MSRVMIHPATYETVDRAVEQAFELFPLTLKGKKVLIKPNVLRASKAMEGIVTNPAVLRAVVEKVEAMEPGEIVVGDNPGMFNYGENEECFRITGLEQAAKGYYRNIGNDSKEIAFNAEYMPVVSLSSAVVDADMIISLPKFKTHGLTVMTGAIKNSYGFLPGAIKARLHKAAGSPERFHDMIAELFALRIPDLFIVDAVVGMEGNGPASPELRDIGLILASDNGVATDAVIAAMMGCDPGRLRFLRKAAALGLGGYDLDKIEIIGRLTTINNFKLPPLGGEALMSNVLIQDLIRNRSGLVPRIDEALCTGCGTCVNQCPVSALSMNGDFPEVDAGTCITCFCCQEICPEKALILR